MFLCCCLGGRIDENLRRASVLAILLSFFSLFCVLREKIT